MRVSKSQNTRESSIYFSWSTGKELLVDVASVVCLFLPVPARIKRTTLND